MSNGNRRNAALIASVVTVPLLVLILITGSRLGSSGPGRAAGASLPALRAAAPSEAAAHAAECTSLLEALPLSLG